MSSRFPATSVLCPTPQTLEKLLRDELGSTEVGPVEEHVGTCADCQRVLGQLVGSLPDALMPPTPPRKWAADEDPPALPGYEPLGRIDAGGMGVVWRIHDLQFGRDLAVKVMASWGCVSRRLIERFIAEAQVCAQLTHPFIVPIHSMGRLPDGRPYYTMKLVEGQTLEALLKGGPAPAERRLEFVQIFDQVCKAVAFAHGRGVIHRDLKPENVMVGAHAEVQLMDWGLAKVLAGEGRSPREGSESTPIEPEWTEGTRTRSGSVLGTAAYMAPEQAQGRIEEVDQQSDVFGLGGILCRILTGEPPYTGPNAEAIRSRAAEADLGETRARLRRCNADPELIGLAERCLAPRKVDRFADAGALAAQLAAYQTRVQERLRQVDLERAAAQTAATAERTTRRRTRALAVAVVVLMALAAGCGLWAQQQANELHADKVRQEIALRQEVATDLDQAIRLRQAGHFDASRRLLEQARQLPAGGGLDDLRLQVERCLADTALAQRLDDTRQRASNWVEGKYDFAGAEQDYAAALAESGLGQEGEDPREVGARVQTCAVRAEVVAALDDWAGITSDDRRLVWLLAVNRAADPDPDRDRLRQPKLWRDREALTRLAKSPATAHLSPQLTAALARALMRHDGDAVPLLRAAQERHPEDFWLNVGLGQALSKVKQWDEVVAYYRAALALRPRSPHLHNDLGTALYRRGQVEAAIHNYEAALRLDPNHVKSHYNLGLALNSQGQVSAALRQFEEALRLNPNLAEAHCNLGLMLQRQGCYAEALSHLQQGHQLGSKQRGWRSPSAQWVRYAERLVRLDHKLSAILVGQAQPVDAYEQLELAGVCKYKRLYTAAVRFYAGAFAARPQLADGKRYGAACAAALAGCGQGQDAAHLSDVEKARLRRQAREWLAADLTLWTKQDTRDGSRAQKILSPWVKDPALAGVRDPGTLDKLSEEERREWQSLWQQLDRYVGKASK